MVHSIGQRHLSIEHLLFFSFHLRSTFSIFHLNRLCFVGHQTGWAGCWVGGTNCIGVCGSQRTNHICQPSDRQETRSSRREPHWQAKGTRGFNGPWQGKIAREEFSGGAGTSPQGWTKRKHRGGTSVVRSPSSNRLVSINESTQCGGTSRDPSMYKYSAPICGLADTTMAMFQGGAVYYPHVHQYFEVLLERL